MSASRRHAGFTLLEAIVAMVLIGGAGMALFAWINGGLESLSRVHDANARSEATMNVLEYMQRVNPMLTPEGQAAFGNYSISWRAQPIGEPTNGIQYPRGVSPFQLALYRVNVAVLSDRRPWFDLELQQVGFRRTRSAAMDG